MKDVITLSYKEWCFEFSPILNEDTEPVDFKGKTTIISNAEEEATLWSLVDNNIINALYLEADKYFITQEHYGDPIIIVFNYKAD